MNPSFRKQVTIYSCTTTEIPTGWLLTINGSRQGVAAPLPNYSLETTREAGNDLKALCRELINKTLCAADVGQLSLLPSVAFALQSALLTPTSTTCQTHALILDNTPPTPSYSTCKIKVGEKSISEVLDLTHKLPQRLRLDFNQKWELEKALALAKKLPWDRIDYLEEPLKDPEMLTHFPYPIALDETLRLWPLEKVKKLPHLAALVIKPTLLGDVLPFAETGIPLVLSSCFEGPVGIECLARLAHHLGIADRPHGLDTLRYTESMR